MKIWLTHNLFGDKVCQISDDITDVTDIFNTLSIWKSDNENKRKYKIEPYDRLIFADKTVAIDFGDYSYFILIDDMSQDDIANLKDYIF